MIFQVRCNRTDKEVGVYGIRGVASAPRPGSEFLVWTGTDFVWVNTNKFSPTHEYLKHLPYEKE